MNVSATRFVRALGVLLMGLHALSSQAQNTGGMPAEKITCPPSIVAPTAEDINAGAHTMKDRGFLWRISDQYGSSYLYGTIHAAKLEWLFPGPQVKQALADSDVVALELDLMSPDIQRRMDHGMRTSRQGRPANDLPTSLAKRLQQQLRAECLDPDTLGAMAPEIQMMLATMQNLRRESLHSDYGIDGFLAGYARGQGKLVVSLETPESHLNLVLQPRRSDRIELLEASLRDLRQGTIRRVAARGAQAWANSDLSEFDNYRQWCECLSTARERSAEKRLLDDRNPPLAQQIDTMHRNGQRVFAAVGALHMAGPQGLPALMAAKGYRVERIPF